LTFQTTNLLHGHEPKIIGSGVITHNFAIHKFFQTQSSSNEQRQHDEYGQQFQRELLFVRFAAIDDQT